MLLLSAYDTALSRSVLSKSAAQILISFVNMLFSEKNLTKNDHLSNNETVFEISYMITCYHNDNFP